MPILAGFAYLQLMKLYGYKLKWFWNLQLLSTVYYKVIEKNSLYYIRNVFIYSSNHFIMQLKWVLYTVKLLVPYAETNSFKQVKPLVSYSKTNSFKCLKLLVSPDETNSLLL